MKKLIMFLCAAVMAFSLTVHGGSSEVFASTVAEKSQVSLYEKAKQSILDHVDVAYSGLTSQNAPMYFLASNDGKYVALVLENADQKRYIKFIGSAVIDEESGILTVTDSEKGYTFGFTAEKQEDGTFFLDCGNLGECYLKPDKPGTVVDNIVVTFQNMEDATDELMESIAMLSIVNYIDIAYAGLTAEDGAMYYLASSDGEFAALIMESPDETSYIKFVGTTAIDENGLQTVTDSEKGYIFGFTAEAQEDGSYLLDCGDLGECYLEPSDTETVMGYIAMTFEEMEDVTDEFIAAYAANE